MKSYGFILAIPLLMLVGCGDTESSSTTTDLPVKVKAFRRQTAKKNRKKQKQCKRKSLKYRKMRLAVVKFT